jgi:hypothetical protein
VQGWPTEDLVAKKVLSELVIFELGSEWWERARLAEIYFKNIFFFLVLGLELRAYTLSHSTSPIFVKGLLR